MRPSAPPARPDRRAQAPFAPAALAAGRRRRAFASLAAVGLLRPPLGLWPSYAEMQADYRTATGEQRRYALDAQQLTLALNTQTSLNVATRDGRPEIELVAGEAAIQARRDQPCLVKAGAARCCWPTAISRSAGCAASRCSCAATPVSSKCAIRKARCGSRPACRSPTTTMPWTPRAAAGAALGLARGRGQLP